MRLQPGLSYVTPSNFTIGKQSKTDTRYVCDHSLIIVTGVQ